MAHETLQRVQTRREWHYVASSPIYGTVKIQTRQADHSERLGHDELLRANKPRRVVRVSFVKCDICRYNSVSSCCNTRQWLPSFASRITTKLVTLPEEACDMLLHFCSKRAKYCASRRILVGPICVSKEWCLVSWGWWMVPNRSIFHFLFSENFASRSSVNHILWTGSTGVSF